MIDHEGFRRYGLKPYTHESEQRLRLCKNIEYIDAILRGAINTKYIDNA